MISLGINANVHLLPFFVKNKDSRWEFYLSAKYGGAYLINHGEFWSKTMIFSSDNPNVHFVEINDSGKRSRQIFGVGIG